MTLHAAIPPERRQAMERRYEALPPNQRAGMLQHPAIAARIGATCQLTPRQVEAEALLNSASTHCMLFGGSRSGKTFAIVRKIVARALAYKSRHAILRFRFNHVVTSIAMDTLPRVMEMCFPGAVADSKLDKSLWVYTLPNGSEIWFGGLDEKERTEKILGQEYATIYLNECSQIPLASRDIAVTRLAQSTPMPLKMLYDCNPPSRRHWTHQLFLDKLDPARHQPLVNPGNYASLLMNPEHNRANLKPEYIAELENLDERKRKRFLLGVFSDDEEDALWTPEMLDNGRLIDRPPPDMQRIMVAVDPSGCSGPEDLRSDEIGVVVCGLGATVAATSSRTCPGGSDPTSGNDSRIAYNRQSRDAVVGEMNYGGAIVGEVIRTAVSEGGYPFNSARSPRHAASIVRAEPIAALVRKARLTPRRPLSGTGASGDRDDARRLHGRPSARSARRDGVGAHIAVPRHGSLSARRRCKS